MDKKVDETGLFNLGMAISVGEKKPVVDREKDGFRQAISAQDILYE